MVVWRWHGTEPPDDHLRHMQARLREVAAERVGEFWVDDHMRNIPDHFHAHARPKVASSAASSPRSSRSHRHGRKGLQDVSGGGDERDSSS